MKIIKWLLQTFDPLTNELISKEKAKVKFDGKCKEKYNNNWKLK